MNAMQSKFLDSQPCWLSVCVPVCFEPCYCESVWGYVVWETSRLFWTYCSFTTPCSPYPLPCVTPACMPAWVLQHFWSPQSNWSSSSSSDHTSGLMSKSPLIIPSFQHQLPVLSGPWFQSDLLSASLPVSQPGIKHGPASISYLSPSSPSHYR